MKSAVFVVGKDYHLGDLLWLTAVLREYRRQGRADHVMMLCPDRPISHVLDHNPLIDELHRAPAPKQLSRLQEQFGNEFALHDLRMVPLAIAMLRRSRQRLPWLYYRDLWALPRGQWLANFLDLGPLHDYRPSLHLVAADREAAARMPEHYVVLAPHVGQYRFPMAGAFWRRVKSWDPACWASLAASLRGLGYQPVTLAAQGQMPIAGTTPLLGSPIRQAAGVIERAAALVTGESGLWFIAAALRVPFIIVPWWLPRSVDWPGPMHVPHRLVYREQATVKGVLSNLLDLVRNEAA